jgi:scyllo-inositol 2-dehydrogenase (NADP+)
MNRPLKVGVVGLGWVALHRHIPVMERNPRFQVTGVIDRHKNRAQEIAARGGYRYCAKAENLQDVPWIDEVDAITIATAPMGHHGLASEALELG